MTAESGYSFFPEKRVTVIKAPFNGGQGKLGVEQAPEKLIEYGLLDDIKEQGWKYEIEEPLKDDDWRTMRADASDMYKKCKRPHMVSEGARKVYEASLKARENNTFPLTVGGDHAIGMATLLAFVKKYPDGGIIWVDAHTDINTPTTTESGNLHGCPVAFAMGLDQEDWPTDFDWIKQLGHFISPKQIAYIGLRDVDKGEKKIIKDLGIAAFSMHHVDKYGINAVVQKAIKAINPTGKAPIHVSYDVDGIDPQYVASTGTPVRGGLSLREGLFIMEELAASRLLAGLDIVEVNPALGPTKTHTLDTVNTGLSISRCALGDTIL